MSALIRSASLTNYDDVARRAGLDPARMLREFALPARALRDPELKIPLDAVRQLLEVSAERSRAESFGLMMAEARRMSNLGPLGLLVREQPTLRLAIDALIRYGKRLNEALFMTLEETGNVAVLREVLIAGHSGPIRQSTELAIGVAYRVLGAYLGPQWRPKRVCFAHEAPADRSVHERVFGRNVDFGQDFNGIVCARADLDAPNSNADPELARLARRMLDAEPEEGADMTAQVRELVVTLLGTGDCTIDRAAQHLGVDRRTIHRHLQRHGATFSGIVDAVRRELAERYLRESQRTLAEVSSLLGFAAPSGFSRWYQRQFGVCASAQRSKLARKGR